MGCRSLKGRFALGEKLFQLHRHLVFPGSHYIHSLPSHTPNSTTRCIMAHACTHTTCLHDNYNERATYSSKTKTSHHERTATCHPCCASTTEMCSTGMKVSSKHTLPQFVARQTLKYPCRHTGCVYSYKHQPSRSDHEREAKNHTRCIPSECDGCRIISAYERAAPRTHERPPDPKLTRFIQQLEQTAKSPPATLQGATFAKKLWGQEPDDTYVVQFGKDGPQVVPFNVLKENGKLRIQ